MRERDPIRFRDQTQQVAVAVERPVPAARLDAQPILVVAVERGFRNPAIRLAIDQVDCLVADPVDRNDPDRMARNHAPDHGTGLDVIEDGHAGSPTMHRVQQKRAFRAGRPSHLRYPVLALVPVHATPYSDRLKSRGRIPAVGRTKPPGLPTSAASARVARPPRHPPSRMSAAAFAARARCPCNFSDRSQCATIAARTNSGTVNPSRVALCFGRHDVALRIACLTFHRIREHLASDRLTGGL